MRTLNPKQRNFARGVFEGKSAVQAYKDAGYSHRSAKSLAARLMAHDGVRARIAELQDEADTAAVLSLQETLVFLADVVRTPAGKVKAKSPLCHEKRKTKDGYILKMPNKLEAAKLSMMLQGHLKREGGGAASIIDQSTTNNTTVVLQERTKEAEREFAQVFNEVKREKLLKQSTNGDHHNGNGNGNGSNEG